MFFSTFSLKLTEDIWTELLKYWMAELEYTKAVQESQVKIYPKIDLGKLCKQSIVFGYSGKTSPNLFLVCCTPSWMNKFVLQSII